MLARNPSQIDNAFPNFANRETFDYVLRRIPNAEDMSCPFDEHPSIQIGPIIIWILDDGEIMEANGGKYQFVVDIYNLRVLGKSQSIAVKDVKVLIKFANLLQILISGATFS